LGVGSLFSTYVGNYNTAVGQNSLYLNTGSNNTALGYFTGSSITSGTNLSCIGYNAQPTLGSAANQITLGNNQITSLRCNVTTITSLSDARDKKNIQELPLGLDFVMKLKPRQFNWDKREWYENNVSDGSKMKETPTAGFIAQELDEAQTKENVEWLNLVLKDNPEKFEATPGNLLPVMVKAIQELKKENDELKERISRLEKQQKKLTIDN
jgi:endosialidase-like protein